MNQTFTPDRSPNSAAPGLVDAGRQEAPSNGIGGNEGQTTMTSASIERAYGRLAPLYDVVFGWVFEPGRKEMTAAVNGLAPATLLEIGIGTGLTLDRYASRTAVTGIDLSGGMLAQAQRRADQLPGRRIDLRLMNAESMEFDDASFDCVSLPYVLSVTPDPDRLVREIRRVCKPGGTILILNHFSGSRFWRGLERAFNPLAERIGFRSDFGYDRHVLEHDWQVQWSRTVNPLGLSQLVSLKNTRRTDVPG